MNVVREVLCHQKRWEGKEESVRPVNFEHEEVNQHVSPPGTSCSLQGRRKGKHDPSLYRWTRNYLGFDFHGSHLTPRYDERDFRRQFRCSIRTFWWLHGELRDVVHQQMDSSRRLGQRSEVMVLPLLRRLGQPGVSFKSLEDQVGVPEDTLRQKL